MDRVKQRSSKESEPKYMGTMNKVILVGRLGSEPEERRTTKGVEVSQFPIATNDYRRASPNATEAKPEWHRVVVYGKAAAQCNRYLSKGRPVCIDGSLKTRSWANQSVKNVSLQRLSSIESVSGWHKQR